MRKAIKLLGSTFVAIVLSVLIATPAFAAIEATKTQTVYMSSVGGTGYAYIDVSGLTAKQSVAKNSVKSSNTKVAVPSSLGHSKYTSQALAKGSSAYSYYSASISVDLKKPGTATISYKVGSKTYKTKVTALKYVNPLKSLKIAGGKNIAGQFKSGSYASGKAPKKKGAIVAKAASGWKITSVSYSVSATGRGWSHSSSKGLASSSLNVPMAMKSGGYISVSLKNTKTGGTQYISYNLN